MLWRSLRKEYKTSAHTYAEKYNNNHNFRNRFPLNTLAISFSCKSNPRAHENKALKNYMKDFGEIPPCNSKI